MRTHLTILAAESSSSEADFSSIVDEWAGADLLESVALVDLTDVDSGLGIPVLWVGDGGKSPSTLREVLTGTLWESVSLVSVRSNPPGSYPRARFDTEDQLRNTVDQAFLDTESFRAYTVSIADPDGSYGPGFFGPRWDGHLVHDPILIADNRVAVLPIEGQDRPTTCMMTALLAAGGLRWQNEPLVDLSDEPMGHVRRVRVVRAQLRVINAGRFLDDVLAGAFPESGHWDPPPNLQLTQAQSPNIATQVADDLVALAGFRFKPFEAPPARLPEQIGIIDGLRMFARHLADAARKAPFIVIDRFVTKIGEEVAAAAQRLTFGEHSAVVMKFRPGALSAETDAVLSKLQQDGMPETGTPAIPNPEPWIILRKTAFGLVDGGDLPDGIRAPQHNTQRLQFGDPLAIGPAPSDKPFELSDFECEILDLTGNVDHVDPMDVVTVRAVDQALAERINPDEISRPVDRRADKPSPTVEPPAGDRDESVEDDPGDPGSHIPSHPGFNPADYTAVGAFYQGAEGEMPPEYRESQSVYQEALRNHETIDGRWKVEGRCDHCGAAFHHGVAYLHGPSDRLVHVGHICANKSGLPVPDDDPTREFVNHLYQRWQPWFLYRRNSLLWKVGDHLARGIDDARRELATGMADRERPDTAGDLDQEARARLRLWTLRSLFSSALGVGAVVANLFIALIPLLWAFVAAGGAIAALVVRLGYLTRDLARLQTRRDEGDRVKQVALLRVQHSAKELARLVNARDQFEDWQAIIRTVVHTPFGDLEATSQHEAVSASVPRPQSFVYATASPSPKQLNKLQRRARLKTVNRDWLSTAFTEMRQRWQADYATDLLSDLPAEPESDNSPSGTVRTHMPGTGEPVFAPRHDFRDRMTAGRLHGAVISVLTEQIIESLEEMVEDEGLDNLLSPVRVIGPGQALNGMLPTAFLTGINGELSDVHPFQSAVFGARSGALTLHLDNIRLSLPSKPGALPLFSPEAITQGRDLILANCRLVLSDPLDPEMLAGYDGHPPSEEPPDDDRRDPSGPSVV